MWKQCEALQEDIVAFRRDLHRIPEVGTQLPLTQAYICKVKAADGYTYYMAVALLDKVLGKLATDDTLQPSEAFRTMSRSARFAS